MSTRQMACAWLSTVALVLTTAAVSGQDIRLVEAVKSGGAPAVRALLQQRVNVNATEPDGTTALHWAAYASDLELTQLLLGAGANVNAANRYGVVPLLLAVEGGNVALVDAMLKAGANPNATLPMGDSVLMRAARTGTPAIVKALIAHGATVNAVDGLQGQTALTFAAVENHAAAVKELIAGGADVNARSKPLPHPEYVFDVQAVVRTAQATGSWTALMFAAREGAIDAVHALTDAGANVDIQDDEGNTALIIAIYNVRFDTAAVLLDKGADPNLYERPDGKGITVETVAGTGVPTVNGSRNPAWPVVSYASPPLYTAVDMHTLTPLLGRASPVLTDSIDAVEIARRLLRRGANPNTQLKRPISGRHTVNSGNPPNAYLGEGTTALARAAASGDVAMMTVLLEGGADPLITQKGGTTVAMIATAAREQRVYDPRSSVRTPATEADALAALKMLLDGSVPIDINAANSEGQTALHNAAARGADTIVRYLVEKGAKLDATDHKGRLPIDMARQGRASDREFESDAPPPTSSTLTLLTELMASKGIAVPTASASPAPAQAR